MIKPVWQKETERRGEMLWFLRRFVRHDRHLQIWKKRIWKLKFSLRNYVHGGPNPRKVKVQTHFWVLFQLKELYYETPHCKTPKQLFWNVVHLAKLCYSVFKEHPRNAVVGIMFFRRSQRDKNLKRPMLQIWD